MKRLSSCILVSAAISLSHANTYVGPRIPNSSCSSSASLVLSVRNAAKDESGAPVEIYREVENGERIAWRGVTSSDGAANPTALSPGRYRVFVDAGERSGEMTLLVGDFKGTTKCTLKIGAPYGPEAASIPQQPSEVQLKDFRGVIVDEKGVLIPHVIVQILPNGSPKSYIAQFQSDDKGKFEFHLDPGSYSAIFSYQGYRPRWLILDVGHGWQGCKLSMFPANSSLHDVQPTEWTLLRCDRKRFY